RAGPGRSPGTWSPTRRLRQQLRLRLRPRPPSSSPRSPSVRLKRLVAAAMAGVIAMSAVAIAAPLSVVDVRPNGETRLEATTRGGRIAVRIVTHEVSIDA